MFLYKCKKCDKVWYYPVDKCIFCGKKLEEIVTKGAKVRASSDVYISSPDNQEVPYKSLLLEDNDGHFFLRKVIIGGLGEGIEHKLKSDDRRSRVSISKVKYDPILATVRSLRLIGGNIASHRRVFIKPNLALAKEGNSGIVTNPLVVEGVLRYLIEEVGVGSDRIVVGECSVLGFDTKKALEKSGLGEVCAKYGIKFFDLAEGKYLKKKIKYKGSVYVFDIAEEIFKADLIINVPVVKTHFQTRWSLALKNMKGVINYQTRKRMHQGDLDLQVALLNKALPKYLTVMDGSVGLEGMGPAALGKRANLGLVLASMDPVAIDKAISIITGLKPARHCRIAFELGLGEIREANIVFLGEELAVVKKQFEGPDSRLSPHVDLSLIDGKPCSGCLNSLWTVLRSLNAKRGRKGYLAFGSDIDIMKLGEKEVGAVGNCAIKSLLGYPYLDSQIAGCPPSIEKMTEYVSTYLERKKNGRKKQ